MPRAVGKRGTGLRAFSETLQRLNTRSFSFSGRGNTVTVNVTRKDGTTTSFRVPVETANEASRARASGKMSGSGGTGG